MKVLRVEPAELVARVEFQYFDGHGGSGVVYPAIEVSLAHGATEAQLQSAALDKLVADLDRQLQAAKRLRLDYQS